MKSIAIGENHLYGKVYAKGKKFVGRLVVVYLLADRKAAKLARANPAKRKINRVGLTVGKKIGGAVIRSRVKRIIREAWRQTALERPVKRGFLVVFVAREAATGAKTRHIAEDMRRAFAALNFYEAPPASAARNGSLPGITAKDAPPGTMKNGILPDMAKETSSGTSKDGALPDAIKNDASPGGMTGNGVQSGAMKRETARNG